MVRLNVEEEPKKRKYLIETVKNVVPYKGSRYDHRGKNFENKDQGDKLRKLFST